MKLIECPRDAIQGIKHFLPTEAKVKYLNMLLKAGFDTIDFGSFVSPKAIPQMADTAEVVRQLDTEASGTRLLAIIANERGAADACTFEQVTYLGYPFSISETFQQRNTGASIAESVERVKVIQELCVKHDKQLVIYISMGFGNPYGDEWNAGLVMHWVDQLAKLGIGIFSLADTVGLARPADILYLFGQLQPGFSNLELGVHLHASPGNVREKLEAAWQAGCRRFDSAILGYGGCPMAGDELVGNMPTDQLVNFLHEKGVENIPDKQIIKSLEQAFQQLINA